MKNNNENYRPLGMSRFLWGSQKNTEIFRRKVDGLPLKFSIRPLDLQVDVLTLHHWVNVPYSYSFWQMKGATSKDIADYYESKITSDKLYPFMISYGPHPITLFELYNVEKDELARHLASVSAKDKGIHTLMAPPRYLLTKLPQKIRNISTEALVTALQFAFSFESIDRIYTEPHVDNFHANELAKQMGWAFIKEIDMESKKANLFCFEKKTFQDKYLNK